MNNSIEDYDCSFKVSKLLKEKGFDCACLFYYNNQGNYCGIDVYRNYNVNKVAFYRNTNQPILIDDFNCIKPTHSLAIEWIRINFGIWIFVTGQRADWKYNIKLPGKLGFSSICFPSPQEATEAALLYTLTNLIK